MITTIVTAGLLAILALAGYWLPTLGSWTNGLNSNFPPSAALAVATFATILWQRWRPASHTPLLVVSTAALGVLFGPATAILVVVAPAIWAILLAAMPAAFGWRLLLLSASLATGAWARAAGFNWPAFVFLFCQWLRFASVCLEWDSVAGTRLQKARLAVLHLTGLPFLLSPAPMEWIRFPYFARSMQNRSGPDFSRGHAMLAWGLANLALHDFLRSRVEPFRSWAWNPEMLGQIEGAAGEHLLAGLVFFFCRLWQYCGFTAIVAGLWAYLGHEIRYDFTYPLLSRNLWQFWLRYHNYGREFLLTNIFYPVSFAASRRIPWRLASALGAIAVILAVGVVHYLSFIPIAGVPFSRTYHWQGSLMHAAWAIGFTFFSYGFTRCCDWALGEKSQARMVAVPIEIALTWTLVAALFYNSFAQPWMGWSNATYLKSILRF